MRGPKIVSMAHKKIDTEIAKKLKADTAKVKKEKASKKNSGAPKRPPSGFFVFMEDFRKSYKESFPDNKSVAVVGKAGGEKWKSMSESEKVPYMEKAAIMKSEYGIAMAAFNSKLLDSAADQPEESDKSSAEVHDDLEQEASS